MTTTDRQAQIAALIAQAQQLGLTAADLATNLKETPTVGDYINEILPTASAGQSHTYKPYLLMFASKYKDAGLDAITTTDVTRFVAGVQDNARATRGHRRNSRDGRSAKENSIAALRWMFQRAINDRIIRDNPASAVPKPGRPRTTRHGLSADQLTELFQATARGGDDPTLDALLVRFLVESGARREGAINLRLRDVDTERCTVLLREKNDKDGTEQPLSPSLIKAILDFARSRGASAPTDSVFRYKPQEAETVGPPLTRRRFDTLTNRWQATLPFAARLAVTPHVLRHTAIGLVESKTSYAVARAFARHTSKGEVTTTYLQRTIADVAQAIQELTEEEHPLAVDRWELS